MMREFTHIIRRDLRLVLSRAGQAASPFLFFLLAATLFPLGLSPDPLFLQQAAPGLVMIAALLASLLPIERLFERDAADGTLDLIISAGRPMGLYAAGRLIACWLTSGLPLVMIGPVMLGAFGMDLAASVHAIIVLSAATMLLILLGGLGAALTVGARGGSVLLSLLVLPLYIPVLIFAVAALGYEGAMAGNGALFLLLAMLAAALPAIPPLCGMILVQSVQE